MCRASGNNEFRTKNLEAALAESPKVYGCLDVIAFGFPCQDLSIGNQKRKGLEGKKSSIFFECMRIVKILCPKWIFIENVPGLLSSNKGRDFGIVLQKMAECGYGYQWRILNSQYFGVAQRRRRLFVIGCFGESPPPEVLFELESGGWNDTSQFKIEPKCLCLTTRAGSKNDPTYDSYIAQTVSCQKRGNSMYLWQDNYIAETDAERKRETTGLAGKLDTARGIVIGNAVTVPVMEWIGKRILKANVKLMEIENVKVG